MAFQAKSDKDVQHLQPPQSVDAEQAVLGALLRDEDAIHHVIDVLDSEEHFYSPRHRMIFHSVLELYNRSEPVDITTVANALIRNGNLEAIGGRVYLVELAEGVASTTNVAAHANIVLDKSLLRKLIETSNEISRSARVAENPVDDLLDAAEANIFRISESRLRQGFVHIAPLIDAQWSDLNKPLDQATSHSVMTGFTDLDEKTQGLHNGDLVIIAGRPSMGKSALALNIAENVASSEGSRKAVAVFSIEMSKEQLALRMLCGKARISQQKLRARKGISETEMRQLAHYGSMLQKLDILIDDSTILSPLQMRAKARRLKGQYPNLSLIVVDYIQMMHASGRVENRQQEISVISRNLKALAKELSVPVVACSQLSRMVEQRGGDKRPQLSDLRESGAIEQDADVVMFVYRPEYYLSEDERKDTQKNFDKLNMAEIIIAKQRNGPTGVAKLSFQKEFTLFGNLAQGRRDELPPGVEAVGTDMPF